MVKSTSYECNPNCWVEAYADELFRFAYFRVNNHELAEDLVQETFLSALNALEKFRLDCSEKTWLYNILKNKIIDHYRKKNPKYQPLSANEQVNDHQFYDHFFRADGPYTGHWKNETAPAGFDVSPEDLLEEADFMRILMACLSLLPEIQADVFRLKNMDELKTDEICKELNISPSNLWVLIHRAKLQLRGCIEKNWLQNEQQNS